MGKFNFDSIAYVIFAFIINIVSGDDPCYIIGFSENVRPCDDFDNQFLTCDKLRLQHGEDDVAMGFEGYLELLEEINDEHEMALTVYKKMDLADELFFTSLGGICKSLKNKDTPWYPLMHALNASMCPIQAKKYDISNLKMDLHFADDLMSPEFCGEYLAEMSVMKDIVQLSCYLIQLKISEVECKN